MVDKNKIKMELKYKKDVDEWWDEFNDVRDISGRVKKIKEICALNKPIEFYEIGD
ncbi:MAG: hypothetical protein U9O96_03235 [Candidatus Thermoplasmatota archaeon]|nr:hypothetical protein [Candidatus Thermoplasmatota archaeon]